MDDADFVVISSPGSMATRWLAQCLSRVPDLLVLHANNIIVPMEKDPSNKDFSNHDFYHEPLHSYPLEYDTQTHATYISYLKNLRKERKKKKVVAIHTIPCHGSTLREIVEKNNGKLLMIVREPVQTLDSQFSLHSDNFKREGVEIRKIKFYYELAKKYLGQSKNLALSTVSSVDKVLVDPTNKNGSMTTEEFFRLLFFRLVMDFSQHYSDTLNHFGRISNQYYLKKSHKINLFDKVLLREFLEKDCGIYKFEDLTEFRGKTLVNFFAALEEERSIEYLREHIFYKAKINIHRKHQKTSEEVFNQWTKSQCLIFHTVFSDRELFNTHLYFPKLCENIAANSMIKNKYPTPLYLAYEYTVNGVY